MPLDPKVSLVHDSAFTRVTMNSRMSPWPAHSGLIPAAGGNCVTSETGMKSSIGIVGSLLVHVGHGGKPQAREQERVAVGVGLGDCAGRDGAAAAAHVFDQHALWHLFAQSVGKHPRHEIDTTACGGNGDEPDRAVGPDTLRHLRSSMMSASTRQQSRGCALGITIPPRSKFEQTLGRFMRLCHRARGMQRGALLNPPVPETAFSRHLVVRYASDGMGVD